MYTLIATLICYTIIVIYISDTSEESVKIAVKQIISAYTEIVLWGVLSTWGARNVSPIIRFASRLINALLVNIIIFQLLCLLVLREFFSELLLENIEDIHYVPVKYVIVVITSAIIILCISFIEPIYLINKYTQFTLISLSVITILLYLSQNINYFPIYQFVNIFLENNTKKSKYRLDKNIYDNNKSYTHIDDFSLHHDKTLKNVVIMFSEGISADLIGCYNSNNKNVTINIDRICNKSTKVVNYFNHTAATFRGIHGQLTSSYNLMISDKNMSDESIIWAEENKPSTYYDTLSANMKKLGYHTYFIHPDGGTKAFNMMLKSLLFDDVISGDDIATGLKLNQRVGRIAPSGPVASDEELFEYISDKIINNTLKEPYLVCIYNTGTHAYEDSADYDKMVVKFDNSVLRRTSVYDFNINILLKTIEKVIDNTIFIITSDHATFPEPAYRRLRSNDRTYLPIFIDKIPLIIFGVELHLPYIIDANGRNSLDLTPTVLSLLGAGKIRNSFLGKSLEDDDKDNSFHMSAIGDKIFFMTQGDRVIITPSEAYQKPYNILLNNIKEFYKKELNNDIVPAEFQVH